MFTLADFKPLAIAAATAACAGVGVALILALPQDMAHPAMTAEIGQTDAIDPNLARYREMIAAEGVHATPYVLAAGYTPDLPQPKAYTEPSETAALEASWAAEDADIARQARQADVERAAWRPARQAPEPEPTTVARAEPLDNAEEADAQDVAQRAERAEAAPYLVYFPGGGPPAIWRPDR